MTKISPLVVAAARCAGAVFFSAAIFLTCSVALAVPESAPVIDEALQKQVQTVANQLAQQCPMADPSDQQAFDKCRQALFGDSEFKRTLMPITLWGRQGDPAISLKETHLTQLNAEQLAGLYAPLFMFNGTYRIRYNENEKLVQVSLDVAFRNRLTPGQFPYPFWHDSNKWQTYQNAHTMLLWIDPVIGKARSVQFTTRINDKVVDLAVASNPRTFEGKWLWTDEQGKTQPAVTLFDGLFSADNPFKPQLDTSYRTLAISLRSGQCMSCHVPSNPDKMRRLVLLQSPAHAAFEIRRVLKDVRENRMPLDEFGTEQSLDPEVKTALLENGAAFAAMVDAARSWEQTHAMPPRSDGRLLSVSSTP